MEIYKYYDPENELFGYSPNEILYVNVSQSCKNLPPCDSNPNNQKDENTKACLSHQICKHQEYVQTSMKARSSNGRYVDSKNVYISQLIHMGNMIVSCIALGFMIYKKVNNDN